MPGGGPERSQGSSGAQVTALAFILGLIIGAAAMFGWIWWGYRKGP